MKLSHRLLIVFFGASVAAIAAMDIYSRVPKPQDKDEIQKSAQQLLSELKGDIDVAKASVSSQYLREAAGKAPLEEEGEKKTLSESPMTKSAFQKVKETFQRLLK